MSTLTIPLLAAVGVLAVLHAVLYATKRLPKWKGSMVAVQETSIGTNDVDELDARYREAVGKAHIKVLREKIDMAHDRLNELENAVAEGNGRGDETVLVGGGREKGSALAWGFKGSAGIGGLKEDYEKFKSNTQVEIKGIKEILEKVAGKRNEGIMEISDEKLHELAFRAGRNSGAKAGKSAKPGASK